jgi:hypothetical protein
MSSVPSFPSSPSSMAWSDPRLSPFFSVPILTPTESSLLVTAIVSAVAEVLLPHFGASAPVPGVGRNLPHSSLSHPAYGGSSYPVQPISCLPLTYGSPSLFHHPVQPQVSLFSCSSGDCIGVGEGIISSAKCIVDADETTLAGEGNDDVTVDHIMVDCHGPNFTADEMHLGIWEGNCAADSTFTAEKSSEEADKPVDPITCTILPKSDFP